MNTFHIGLDIGSTTIKGAVTDESGKVVYSNYERHGARIREKIIDFLMGFYQKAGDVQVSTTMTGSIGMGIAERYGLSFIQEVVSAARYMRLYHPDITTMIDIGGEDAKVIFFYEGKSPDLRMNGNCAGGTGAFIDQMAILLNVSIEEMYRMALQSERIYPIASRCGVFCKTDIQNLIAKNANRNDIAASIFHAVAVQTVVTLSHGQDISAPLLFCGGPLTFIPALRKAFANYLGMEESGIVLPKDSQLIPALGAAISNRLYGNGDKERLSHLLERIKRNNITSCSEDRHFPPLFQNEEELKKWQEEKQHDHMPAADLTAGRHEIALGIDSGSTTTKVVALDNQGRSLFSYYAPNNGNPIQAARKGLETLQKKAVEVHAELIVRGSCSTGYGEDLIKAAFGMNEGIIETIAHYMAAKRLQPDVSFILDIGGQDMKAIFVEDGVINHIEINEACSSGCGTFIETFAKSLGYTVEDFSEIACGGQMPCDLGTRCTVFMNSKVKQVLREGASIEDIASGLSYSVINNCLYKVLKLKQADELGEHIVVQGGTMHNDSVVRALELLIGRKVSRSDRPELMGAYGCALYAWKHTVQGVSLQSLMDKASYTTRVLQCKGCENVCSVCRYMFQNGNVYYSGNKCERIFANKGSNKSMGANLYADKIRLLFDRVQPDVPDDALKIGIPRVLGFYEDYPFWHALFTACGLRVILSDVSTNRMYEKGVRCAMADNICFPAKLVHGHILNLQEKGVDRIFLPYVVYERLHDGQNSFNCPIVTGYSDVIRSSMKLAVPLDAPTITFKDSKALKKEIRDYLRTLGIDRHVADKALHAALAAQQRYEEDIAKANLQALEKGREAGHLIIVLAGRPYHADQLVQHKLADIVAASGVDCLTTDVARIADVRLDDTHFISQWAYPQQILKAAKWTSQQDMNIQFVELTSFGCGPDAFMLDEIHSLLARNGKTLTQLKIDDIDNVGSLKLRVRSLVDSLKLNLHATSGRRQHKPFITTPVYTEEERRKRNKIIVPYFTDFITPLVPSFLKLAGYDADVLPISDPGSDKYGLRYANNEICYPATLIVGDIIKAFESGAYDAEKTTVLITQTGGQCRASNYISLIKKALVDAGYEDVPVVSLTMDSNMQNNQPGFRMNMRKFLPIALATILYTDAVSRMYYAALPREKEKGLADKLRDKYLDIARNPIERNQPKELVNYLQVAALDFNRITLDKDCPRVGIVGEIFLKFNSYAQRGITRWFSSHDIEVEAPVLSTFFLQSFVNREVNSRTGVESSRLAPIVLHGLYKLINHRIKKVNKACSSFRYYRPIDDIYTLADNARGIVSLSAQFGEGWLLPGEVATMVAHGITHVVSLQPFGCIANHIVSKGIETRLRKLFPQLGILQLDFDSGVSEVNIANRLLLFANDLLEKEHASYKPGSVHSTTMGQ